MLPMTIFLVGAAVGGGAKWAYDKWQENEDRPTLDSAREKSAESARNFGQSVRNLVQRKKDEGETAATEVIENSNDAAVEGAAA